MQSQRSLETLEVVHHLLGKRCRSILNKHQRGQSGRNTKPRIILAFCYHLVRFETFSELLHRTRAVSANIAVCVQLPGLGHTGFCQGAMKHVGPIICIRPRSCRAGVALRFIRGKWMHMRVPSFRVSASQIFSLRSILILIPNHLTFRNLFSLTICRLSQGGRLITYPSLLDMTT